MAGIVAVRSTIVATYVNPAGILVVFTCNCQVLPESTNVGGPPELPATITGISTGAGVTPPEEGWSCTMMSKGSMFVGDFPLGHWPVGETLNLKGMLDVWFLLKLEPPDGEENPPSQISNPGFEVC